jgi:uncharacterized repeat protein (TIGR03803 family)
LEEEIEMTAYQKKILPRALPSFILTIVFGIASLANANYTNIHDFAGGAGDGKNPYGSISISGNTLYGMTYRGGINTEGVIFKVEIDGSNYTNLHEFTGGTDDGKNPYGSLVLLSNSFYGMTSSGGDSGFGVIFKIDTNGNNYTILHEFAGGEDDGRAPRGSLTLSGDILYGMTYNGGDPNRGVIFKIDTDGNNYTNLHAFAGGNNDGCYPHGNITLAGSTLYGMTYNGGDDNFGVIFKMDSNGNNYTNLHEFTGGNNDGKYPYASLALSGGTLYGTTYQGGDNSRGVIFKIDTDGNNYTNLHEFTGGNDDGQNPRGTLIVSWDSLAGITYSGGNGNGGVIFVIGINGSNYTNLHEFAGGSTDGQFPYYTSLLENDGLFYGMTFSGGISNNGVIFRQIVPEPDLYSFPAIVALLFVIYYLVKEKISN